MYRWKGINEFIAVIDQGSFTKAAEHLGVAPSQVSKRVSELENRLTVRLLHRTTRAVSLTHEGEVYYSHCRGLVSALNMAETEIRGLKTEIQGSLRINVAGSFQPSFQVELFAGFIKQNPDLDVQVTFTDDAPSIVDEGYDLSVVIGELKDSSMVAFKMNSTQYVICAAPEYIEERGMPETPEDLDAHNCLQDFNDHWYFGTSSEGYCKKVKGNWKSNNTRALLDAACLGLGLIQLPNYVAEPYIQEGTLQQVLEKHTVAGKPIWGVVPTAQHISAKVRLLIDYMIEIGVSETGSSEKEEAQIINDIAERMNQAKDEGNESNESITAIRDKLYSDIV